MRCRSETTNSKRRAVGKRLAMRCRFAANGELRKDQQNDEVLRFVEFWKQRTGRLPGELIFDSKLTTYANLDKLNRMGVHFITLRRRSKKLLDEIAQTPMSAWRRVELESVS